MRHVTTPDLRVMEVTRARIIPRAGPVRKIPRSMLPIDSTFGIGLGMRVAVSRPSKAAFFLARIGWAGVLLGRRHGAACRNVARSFRWIGDAVEEKHRHDDDRNDGQQDPHQAAADVALLVLLLLLGCHEHSVNLQGASAMSFWRLLLTVDFLR
ncbi:hypothetical protein D9M68_813110 [compost metagenome]